MATASKRLTRKQLREPDWFQVGLEHAVEYFNEHKPLVFSALAAIVILLAALWVAAIQSKPERRRFPGVYQSSHPLPKSEIQRSNTRVRKDSSFSLVALFSARAHLPGQQLSSDASVGKSAERRGALRGGHQAGQPLSPNSAGHRADTEEQMKQCKVKRLNTFAEAEKITGALQSGATLGKARCAEQIGDIQSRRSSV